MPSFEKHSFLALRRRFEQKFLCFLQLIQLNSVFFFKYKFFILERIMMTLRKALLMKEFSLARKIFLSEHDNLVFSKKNLQN